MQRVHLPSLVLVVSILFSIASCKKSVAESEVESKTIVISKSGWQLQKDEVQNDSGSITDLITGRSACRKDDITLFKADNTIEINEGAPKCDVLHPQIISVSSWNFSDSETKLQMGGGYTYNIEKLDKNNLVFFYSYSNGGSVAKRRLTYTH
jgi:hypothetical protein